MNLRISETVKHLLIINVVMFIGTMTVANGAFYDWFALYFPINDAFRPWQIITHMFMHGGLTHILFNMFALWMFGTPVEQRLGSKKFLFIYFSAGLGAALFQLGYYYWDYFQMLQPLLDAGLSKEAITDIVNFNIVSGNQYSGALLKDQLIPYLNEHSYSTSMVTQETFTNLFEANVMINNGSMVGASGCIMGILAAFGVLYPEAKLMMIFLPIPIKAKYFIPGIILLDLISALTGHSFFSPSNTAYMAHVGGALVGFFIMWYWRKNQFNNNRWDL
ncbi:rhomboid family intramembrane serine protease [Mangrovimonas futianensis]|uniref:rhomboid family intramembrane serine protease n=1 Tax=Mangrovimonas futianensis TaxID=2895523 RepID=UPI001E492505|nr:rhomboid family intramembrane serine protease [Mangrovimonas futianensis]MCF1422223.1 rhomboid family intramembrane serine protease [Mangrovimonas futianensis]